MSKIFVTGGAGFIGSHFIRYALAREPTTHIVNFDLLTYAGNLANVADVAEDPRYTFVQGDVADAAAVEEAMRGCDAVVHCAAETHVDRSITDATPFLRTNILGTAVVLDAVRTQGITRMLHVSTDEVYGDVATGLSREEDVLRPNSPYAASKAAADNVAHAAYVTHGTPVIISRASNNFGPYQLPEKLIPLCITHLLAGETIPLYGDGAQIRDWLYVTDHCAALLLLLRSGVPGEIYNVSSEQERTNRQIIDALVQYAGADDAVIIPVQDRPGHDRRYALDSAKLRRLGWSTAKALDVRLQETNAWYQEHATWWQPLKEQLRKDAYHWLAK